MRKLIAILCAGALFASPVFAENLLQSTKSIQTGFVKYSKKIPQCSAVKSSITQGVLQRLDYGFGKVEAFYKINESGLESVTLNAPNSSRDEGQLRAMMCATTALMQSLKPELEDQESAMSNAAHLWKLSAKAPFTMGFYFDQLTAQHVPFQLKAWKK